MILRRFTREKVDLWPIYRNAQGPIIGKKMMDAGEPVDYFNPDTYGVRTVANSVITSEDVLKKPSPNGCQVSKSPFKRLGTRHGT